MKDKNGFVLLEGELFFDDHKKRSAEKKIIFGCASLLAEKNRIYKYVWVNPKHYSQGTILEISCKNKKHETIVVKIEVVPTEKMLENNFWFTDEKEDTIFVIREDS